MLSCTRGMKIISITKILYYILHPLLLRRPKAFLFSANKHLKTPDILKIKVFFLCERNYSAISIRLSIVIST